MKKVPNYLMPLLTTIFVLLCLPILAQEKEGPVADKPSESLDAADISLDVTETGIDASDYSLDELLDIEIEVASLFAEDERVVGSMVSSISSDQLKW